MKRLDDITFVNIYNFELSEKSYYSKTNYYLWKVISQANNVLFWDEILLFVWFFKTK